MEQIHLEFIKTALKNKKKIAIFDQLTNQSYSYENLLMRALAISKKLKKYEDSYIGIMLPASADMVVLFMASLMAGRVPVLINYLTGNADNYHYAVKECSLSVVISSKKLFKKADDWEELVFIEDFTNDDLFNKAKSFLKSKFYKLFVNRGTLDDLAAIIFSHGSELEPKIVTLSHKNLITSLNSLAQSFNFRQEEVFITALPVASILGFVGSFLTPILGGYTLVSRSNPFNFPKMINNIRKFKVTTLIATPILFYEYFQNSQREDFKSLRIAISGGDRLPLALAQNYLKKYGLAIYSGYETTETASFISLNTPVANKLGSVGRVLPNVKIKIENICKSENCENYKIGKILVKSDLVMKGYLADIEETYYRIHDNWYDTADMGYLDKDGFLFHQGGLKRFVKIGKEMISLVEIEQKVEKHLGEDSYCLAVSIHHPRKGLQIVVATNKEINKKKIIKELSKELSAESVPKFYIYYPKFPISGNGKIDLKKLAKVCERIVKG